MTLNIILVSKCAKKFLLWVKQTNFVNAEKISFYKEILRGIFYSLYKNTFFVQNIEYRMFKFFIESFNINIFIQLKYKKFLLKQNYNEMINKR